VPGHENASTGSVPERQPASTAVSNVQADGWSPRTRTARSSSGRPSSTTPRTRRARPEPGSAIPLAPVYHAGDSNACRRRSFHLPQHLDHHLLRKPPRQEEPPRPPPVAHAAQRPPCPRRSEEHTSELQSRSDLVCR